VKCLLGANVLSDFARGEPAVMARLRQEAPMQSAGAVITERKVEYGLRAMSLAARVREAMRTVFAAE